MGNIVATMRNTVAAMGNIVAPMRNNIVHINNPNQVIVHNNYNNNINIGGQVINNNNNNNGGQPTNNNTNSIVIAERIEDSVLATYKVPAADARETRGVKLPTMKLVGQAFKTKNDEIWSLLMKDEVTSIGVWGMGGVGKTALMENINNWLLKSRDIFSHVYWVTVTHDFKTDKLQNCIANAIGFDLSKENNENRRAAKLNDELIKRQNFVLILDDLWDCFYADEVGIPISINGCKMIFTTRSLDVCRGMGVRNENIINVEPLSEEEAWILFKIELEDYNTELEPLAKAIARECRGLPLGLKTMARSMRGVNDISEWSNALKELKEAEKIEGDTEKVFQVLRYSYNRLVDSTLQQSLLYCALFPEDFRIRREELIEYLIVEGIIKGKQNRQAEHNKGHAILNKLENACLLERCEDFSMNRCVKMHDLIRDMAIQKLREKSSIMVKIDAQLKEIPDVNEWPEDLERVSLMGNYIEEIPTGHSPRCPKLSTLLLRSNWPLRLVPESFLAQMHGLKVLDLSSTRIVKLPDLISELVSLVALLLSQCQDLTYIPSLAKLKELQKLDLSETELEKLPKGMEFLSNLRYLNIWGSKVKEIPTGILPNLSHLQVLILNKFVDLEIIRVKVKEVAGLRKLESLECYFESFSDFRECMEHQSLCTYHIIIGEWNKSSLTVGDMLYESEQGVYFVLPISKCRVYFGGCCISTEQDFKAFPIDIDQLVMDKCRLPGISLFGDSSLSLRCLMKLKSIYLWKCDGIKSLVSLPCPSSCIPKSLENLVLNRLNSFLGVISGPLQSVGLFSCLKYFQIWYCHEVKRLFPIGLLSTLHNLEFLAVRFCDRIEEIQATEGEDGEERWKGEENNSSGRNLSVELIRLPKLKRLELYRLPQLKGVCSGVMICDSLEVIEIVKCPKLKRIPLSYPLPSLESIQAYPKEWWELVEWDQLPDKNLLQPPILELSSNL